MPCFRQSLPLPCLHTLWVTFDAVCITLCQWYRPTGTKTVWTNFTPVMWWELLARIGNMISPFNKIDWDRSLGCSGAKVRQPPVWSYGFTADISPQNTLGGTGVERGICKGEWVQQGSKHPSWTSYAWWLTSPLTIPDKHCLRRFAAGCVMWLPCRATVVCHWFSWMAMHMWGWTKWRECSMSMRPHAHRALAAPTQLQRTRTAHCCGSLRKDIFYVLAILFFLVAQPILPIVGVTPLERTTSCCPKVCFPKLDPVQCGTEPGMHCSSLTVQPAETTGLWCSLFTSNCSTVTTLRSMCAGITTSFPVVCKEMELTSLSRQWKVHLKELSGSSLLSRVGPTPYTTHYTMPSTHRPCAISPSPALQCSTALQTQSLLQPPLPDNEPGYNSEHYATTHLMTQAPSMPCSKLPNDAKAPQAESGSSNAVGGRNTRQPLCKKSAMLGGVSRLLGGSRVGPKKRSMAAPPPIKSGPSSLPAQVPKVEWQPGRQPTPPTSQTNRPDSPENTSGQVQRPPSQTAWPWCNQPTSTCPSSPTRLPYPTFQHAGYMHGSLFSDKG